MSARRTTLRLSAPLGIIAALTLSACTRSAADQEIRARLADYATAAAAVDAARSASFFAPRGTLFEPGIPPIVSPDSIRAFIGSFPGVEPESAQHGRFVMEWRRGADGVWLIERYYRVPLPAGWREESNVAP